MKILCARRVLSCETHIQTDGRLSEKREMRESVVSEDSAPEAHPSQVPGKTNRASQPRRPLIVAGGILALVIAILLTLVIHAITQPAAHPAAAATATPVPKVVYQTDFSQGISGWTLPPHWKYANGQLENDGYGSDPLFVPLMIHYYITQQNYTVSVDFTVESVPNYRACHSYGIEGLDNGGTAQWVGYIQCVRQGVANAGFSEIYVAHADSMNDSLFQEDYTVSHDLTTFTATVQGENLGFCPGNSCLNNLNSTTPLWPVHPAIIDVGVQLTVTKVVITAS